MIRKFENIDCMIGMAEYPDNYFDLAIVDPPYGLKMSSGFTQGEVVKYVDKRNGSLNFIERKQYPIKEWDNNKPNKNYFDELFRVSKNQIIWGGNHFELPSSKCFIVWDKVNGKTNQSDCELAWTNFNIGIKLFRYMWNGMYQGKSIDKGDIQQGDKRLNEERIHPTQKPIKLYRWLLKNYAKEGDLILDTHVGSASSLIACEDTGFEYVGFELDKDYYEAAQKRLKEFRSQIKFDLPEVKTYKQEELYND